MAARSSRTSMLAWLGLGTLFLGVWSLEVATFPSTTTAYIWNGEVAANVFGMALVGGFVAVVAGGLFAMPGRWRLVGVATLVPFTLLLAVFALLSANGGTRCDGGGPCEVSFFFRFGGILVVLGCCGLAALTARMTAGRR